MMAEIITFVSILAEGNYDYEVMKLQRMFEEYVNSNQSKAESSNTVPGVRE